MEGGIFIPVIPAQAGIHFSTLQKPDKWTPAFAGVTETE